MAIQFLTYDDSNLEPGKFYFIEANIDNASNVREVSTVINTLNEATSNIETLKNLALDNQARINNLERTEINKIIEFISRVSITMPFMDATYIEISHSRDIVTNVLVMEKIVDTPTMREYEEVAIEWKEVEELIGGIWLKKVVITLNQPITGYAVIL